MSATRRLYRAAYALDRARRATTHPGRYARNRAKSKALKAAGFWRLWASFWRA